MTVTDPHIMRSIDRLSATVQRQRTSLATSLSDLEVDLKSFVSPRTNDREQLQSLHDTLARAKRDEAAHDASAEVQSIRIELGLANKEIARQASEVRARELMLKAKAGVEAELDAAEAESSRRARAHESALEHHRRAERELAVDLQEAKEEISRLQTMSPAPSGPPPRPPSMSAETAMRIEELEMLLARETERADEHASRVATLEAQSDSQRRLVSSLEEEVDELRGEKAAWISESKRMEEAAGLEISRSGDLRTKLAEERGARKRLEADLSQASARISQMNPPSPARPAASSSMMAPAAHGYDDDDDEDGVEADIDVVAPPDPVWHSPRGDAREAQSPPVEIDDAAADAALAAVDRDDDSDDDTTAIELKLVGSLAPGGVARAMLVGGARGRGGESVADDASVVWYRVSADSGGAGGREQRLLVAEGGGTYLCSSEDVGHWMLAAFAGREARSKELVAPQRPMLSLLQTKLEDGRFECAAEDVANGTIINFVLTRTKVELVRPAPGANAPAAASSRRSKSEQKAVVLHSEALSKGVAMRFDADAEGLAFTVQIATSSKPKKRPPPFTLAVNSRQQRDLILLATAAFVRPAWLQQAVAGSPSSVSFLAPAGDSVQGEGSASVAAAAELREHSETRSETGDNAAKTKGKGVWRALSFGRKKKAPVPDQSRG